MSEKHLYRLDILSWPTPDGRPFDEQDDQFWVDIVESYVNPGMPGYPDWMPDIANRLVDDDPWSSGPPYAQGYWVKQAGLVVPTFTRRHWLARHAAQRRADLFASWGCEVRVVRSEPITWAVDA